MFIRRFAFPALSACWLNPIVVVVIAAVALLSMSTSTEAAAWVRIRTNPVQPSVGEPVLIRVQIVDTQGAQCLDDPDARVIPNRTAYTGVSGPPLDNMELHIHAPNAADPVSFNVKRSVDDPSLWEGRFVFPEPGRWSLQMAYPSWSSGIAGKPGPPRWETDTCTGAEQIVTVLPQSSPDSTSSASLAMCHRPETYERRALRRASGLLGSRLLASSWCHTP